MKKVFFSLFTLGIAVCFPNVIFAQEDGPTAAFENLFNGAFGPVSTRIISDPLYLPTKGQIYGESSYTFDRSVYDTLSYKGVEQTTVKGNDNDFAQEFEYGLTDDITLRLEESYDFATTNLVTDTKAGNPITEDSDRGFNDPTVGATYRALDQANYPVDLDLTANYAPNAFDLKTGNDGTVASGRNEVALTTAVGREMKMFTVQGTASALFLGKADYEVLGTGSSAGDHTIKQSWGYIFGINTETRFTDRLSFNFDPSYTVNTHAKATDDVTGVLDDVITANYWSYATALNYAIIPGRLVFGLTYTFDAFSNGKNIYTNTAFDGINIKHEASIYGARLQYVFN